MTEDHKKTVAAAQVARHAAIRKLTEKYNAEYRAILARERRKVGLSGKLLTAA